MRYQFRRGVRVACPPPHQRHPDAAGARQGARGNRSGPMHLETAPTCRFRGSRGAVAPAVRSESKLAGAWVPTLTRKGAIAPSRRRDDVGGGGRRSARPQGGPPAGEPLEVENALGTTEYAFTQHRS